MNLRLLAASHPKSATAPLSHACAVDENTASKLRHPERMEDATTAALSPNRSLRASGRTAAKRHYAAVVTLGGEWRVRASGLALDGRPLIHQPLQRKGGETDRDQRPPGDVVVAEAVEHETAHPGTEERAELVA